MLGGSGPLSFWVSSTLSHVRAVKESQACIPKANAPSLLPGALFGFCPYPPPLHHQTNDLWRASSTVSFHLNYLRIQGASFLAPACTRLSSELCRRCRGISAHSDPMGQILAGPWPPLEPNALHIPVTRHSWLGALCALAQSQWHEKVMPGANLQVTRGQQSANR